MVTLGILVTCGGMLIFGPLAGCGAILFFVVMLVFTLMALRLQHNVGLACRREAAIARSTWAAAPADTAT